MIRKHSSSTAAATLLLVIADRRATTPLTAGRSPSRPPSAIIDRGRCCRGSSLLYRPSGDHLFGHKQARPPRHWMIVSPQTLKRGHSLSTRSTTFASAACRGFFFGGGCSSRPVHVSHRVALCRDEYDASRLVVGPLRGWSRRLLFARAVDDDDDDNNNNNNTTTV